MILVVDNYDSFVFNVARHFERLGAAVEIVRNDRLGVADIRRRRPLAVLLSPGPCAPRQAGVSLAVVRELSGAVPILGICLGHQVIGEAFGGEIARAARPMHGRASPVRHDGTGLFEGLASPMPAGRYHSLIVRETEAMARDLLVDARSEDGEVMALRHHCHPTYGVQFHPESVLTEDGMAIFARFLERARTWGGRGPR